MQNLVVTNLLHKLVYFLKSTQKKVSRSHIEGDIWTRNNNLSHFPYDFVSGILDVHFSDLIHLDT
jgi:hypothetical protein